MDHLALLLTRQKVPALDRDNNFDISLIKKGAYVISKEKHNQAEIVIMASGSEVQFAIEAKKLLEASGHLVRVVSVPCKELFEKQPETYQRVVIPNSTKYLVVVETGVSFGWQRYFGLPLLIIGMDRFGASAPNKVLEEKFGFNGASITQHVENFIANT